MKYELVSFKICPYVQRSVITMLEKGVDFDITYIDLQDPPAWFQQKSPLGLVPILMVKGEEETVLFESAVINEYLDEVTGGELMGSDPLEKAQSRAWIEFIGQCFQHIYKAAMAKDEDSFQSEVDGLNQKLARLEGQVQGPFFWGEFGLVDSSIAPLFMRIRNMNNIRPMVTLTPILQAWSDALLARDSVKNSVVEDFEELNEAFVRGMGGYMAVSS